METYLNIHVTSTTNKNKNKNIRMIYETGWGYQACTQWCDIVFFFIIPFFEIYFWSSANSQPPANCPLS